MNDQLRIEHIETLARMAAQIAGRNPDEHVRLRLADVIAFDDMMWRYPDFLARAEAAYDALTSTGMARTASPHGEDPVATNRSYRDRPDA